LFLYVCAILNPVIEAAIFTRMRGVASVAVVFLPSCIICGGLIVLLFRPRHQGERFSVNLSRFLASRSQMAWAWRALAAYLAFPVIYFTFGMAIQPFVVEYYRQQYSLLILPSVGVILAVQAIRSLLFLAASLPVLIAWSGSRPRLAILLGFALFVLVGLFHLIQAYWLPSSLRLVHGVEILSDSLLYAAVLVLLMTRDRGRIVRSSVVTLGGADAVGV
jgi:hypothetical protein